jgi:ABC-type transport system involved in cytochrome c biogenesis permease subunit
MLNPKYYLNKPSFFLNLANKYINKIKFLFIISIILNILLLIYNIITDIQQTENFKIFYLHVPAA